MPDLIDFFITKGLFVNYIHVENDEELMLDHSPVVMTISEIVVKKENIPKLINNKTNWNIFCQIIEGNINLQALIRNPELEDETDRLIKSIQA